MRLIEPRPYQVNLIDAVREEFKLGALSVLMQSATGSGKTLVSGWITSEITKRGKRVFFICNRIELVEQTLIAFESLGLDCGIIASGLPENRNALVQICSVDTLRSRLKRENYVADVVIWDEARGRGAAGWQAVCDSFGFHCLHIGLDATPIRLDGKPLGNFFEKMVCGLQIRELIEMGALVPPRVFGGAIAPDLSNLKIVRGDYVPEEVAGAMSGAGLVGDIVDTYKRIGENRQGIVFCPNIAYSQFIAGVFQEAGISALHLDGNTTKPDRDAAIRVYRNGDVRLLTNVGLFEAGFDVPAVGYVVDASPTKSLARYLQRAGRGARPAEGKEYYIYADHAGNRFEHGFPHQDREWSLSARKNKAKGEVKTRTRECPECYMSSPAHKKACEHCDHVFVVEKKEIALPTPSEMQEFHLLPPVKGHELETLKESCKSYADFLALAMRQGYKKGWAFHCWNERKQKSGI
jgi:DNA repair protein RadD